MGPVAAAVIPAGISAVASIFGGERANRINRREAEKNRQFQSVEAEKNRGFQERMRNTEWQAAVADMIAAGINPAVAYSRGGASSPGGSMASGSMAAPAGETLSRGVSSAMEVIAFRKQMQLMEEQINKTRAESQIASADASMKFRDQQMAMQKYAYYFDEHGKPRGPLRELLAAEHGASMANSARSVSDAELQRLSIPERQAVARMFEQLGASPKMLQVAMPFILQLMRGPTR